MFLINYNILFNCINKTSLNFVFYVDIIQQYRKDGNLYDGCQVMSGGNRKKDYGPKEKDGIDSGAACREE